MDHTGMTPRRFGPYVLHDPLGAGAMGQVYRAEDTEHDRWVALKVLSEGFGDDREYQMRFRRESRVAAWLREPHVIPIHDYGDVGGRLFIDMRLVDGQDLRALLQRSGPLSAERAVRLIGQIADALDAAHAQGLVHRDIKPSNVLVTSKDFVYVVDFGVARFVGSPRTSLTVTGTTVGTLEYMAPERFTNRPIDGRADVYSLSCVLAECLSGQQPFVGDDLPALMYAHLYLEPPKPSVLLPGSPATLDDVIARGMAKDPEDRFSTAGELAAAAQEALGASAAVTAAPAAAVEGDTDPSAAAPSEEPPAPAAAGRPPAGPVAAGPGPGSMRDGGDPLPPTRPPPNDGGSDGAGPGPKGPGASPGSGDGPGGAGAPTFVPRGGTGNAGPVTGAGPSTASGWPGRRIGILAAAVAAVVVVATAAYLLWPHGTAVTAGTGVAPGSGFSAPVPPARPATSLATPTAGAAVPVPPDPQFMVVAPNGRFAYITHPSAGVISVFDTTLAAIIATIPIPEGPPQYLTFSPDGLRAYVSVGDVAGTSNSVDFIDTRTNRVIKTVQVGKRPFAPVTSPDGRLLYVPLHGEAHVDVIDIASGVVTAQIPVPPNPHWVAVSRDGTLGYTADHESNVVTALDLRANKVITTIPVGSAPHSIAFSPDGRRVTVVCFVSNDVFVIDTQTQQVVATVPNVGAKPQDIIYAPDGGYFYTANVDDGTVAVLDTTTNAVTARIPTGGSPTSIAVLPNGRQAFVTNFGDGTVRVLDVGAG